MTSDPKSMPNPSPAPEGMSDERLEEIRAFDADFGLPNCTIMVQHGHVKELLAEVDRLTRRAAGMEAALMNGTARESRMDWQLNAIKNRLLQGLQNGLRHFGESDMSGHPHGYSAFLMPDWEARQLLESIDVALSTTDAALDDPESALAAVVERAKREGAADELDQWALMKDLHEGGEFGPKSIYDFRKRAAALRSGAGGAKVGE